MTSRCLVAFLFAFGARPAAAEEQLNAESIFDTSRLLDVRIELPDADWRALCSQTRNFADALGRELPPRPFTYFKGSVVIDGVRIDEVGIRKKGFIGSLDDERPSLKIKLDEYGEKQPIAGVDHLTLNNNKQDESLANQYLAYQLFARAGAHAPRCNLARVTVNGEDLGIYSNVESIRPPFLERQFGDASGRLYEGTLADFFVDRLDRFEVKGGAGEDARASLRQVAEILAAEGDLPVDRLEKLVDLDSFFRFWAVESLIGFWDGYTNNQNNFFLYEKPGNSKLYWIPWGADSVFSAAPPVPFLPQSPPSVQAHSALANRLYRDEKLRRRYRQALLDVLETVWREERLLSELDRVAALARGHLHEQQQGFASKMAGVRWFIEGRRARVLEDLDKWPLDVPSRPRIPMYTQEVGSASGSFTTTWEAKAPKDSYDNGRAELRLVLNGEPVAFEKLGVSAGPGERGPGDPRTKAKPPAVVFTGQREPDGTRLTLAVVTTRDLFRGDSSGPVPVQGMLLQGSGFLAIGSFRFVSGTATFDKAAMEPGAPVEGRLEVKILHMRQR